MASGLGNIVKGGKQLEWWICYDRYPGPYAEPVFVQVLVPESVLYDPVKKPRWSYPHYVYDIDQSNLKSITFDSYMYCEPGDVIIFEGEPYGWVLSVEHSIMRNGTTVNYQPY